MENLKKITLILFCVLPFFGSTQNAFYKKYTTGPFDQGNGLTQLSNSNYAITGSSGGFDNNSGQAFLMLVDTLGNHLWTKDYGGSGDDIGVRVIHVPGDGFFIAGYTGSTLGGDFDFVVYKTDEEGELIWEKTYGGPNWERLYDAKLLADGGLILVGHTEGSTTDGIDMFLVRTDALGDTVWTKTIQTPNDDVAYAVDLLSSTQFVVGGDLGDAGVLKGMIAGFHIDGTQEWLEFYDQSSITTVRDVEVFDNEIFIVGGIYNEAEDYFDMWYAKGSNTGFYYAHFKDNYDGASMNTAIAIREMYGVYIAMRSHGEVLNPFAGGDDAFTLKFDTYTNYNGAGRAFSAFDDDAINKMTVADDGGIVLVGSICVLEQSHSLGTDVMIARIGPNDEAIANADTGLDFVGLSQEKIAILAVHPNPTSDVVNFPEKVQGMNYQILDFKGQVLMRGELGPTLSLLDLTPGMYMVKIEGEKQIWTSKVVKY